MSARRPTSACKKVNRAQVEQLAVAVSHVGDALLEALGGEERAKLASIFNIHCHSRPPATAGGFAQPEVEGQDHSGGGPDEGLPV